MLRAPCPAPLSRESGVADGRRKLPRPKNAPLTKQRGTMESRGENSEEARNNENYRRRSGWREEQWRGSIGQRSGAGSSLPSTFGARSGSPTLASFGSALHASATLRGAPPPSARTGSALAHCFLILATRRMRQVPITIVWLGPLRQVIYSAWSCALVPC